MMVKTVLRNAAWNEIVRPYYTCRPGLGSSWI